MQWAEQKTWRMRQHLLHRIRQSRKTTLSGQTVDAQIMMITIITWTEAVAGPEAVITGTEAVEVPEAVIT